MRPWNDPNNLFGMPKPCGQITIDDFDTFDYQSPIKLFEQNLNAQVDDAILRAVKSVGVDVDKDELIRALQYDREQYAKGFAAGVAADKAKLIESCYKDLVRMIQNSRTDNPFFNGNTAPVWEMAHDCILSCVQSCFGNKEEADDKVY